MFLVFAQNFQPPQFHFPPKSSRIETTASHCIKSLLTIQSEAELRIEKVLRVPALQVLVHASSLAAPSTADAPKSSTRTSNHKIGMCHQLLAQAGMIFDLL